MTEERRFNNFIRGRGAVPARLRTINNVVRRIRPFARAAARAGRLGPIAIGAAATYGAWKAGRAVKTMLGKRRREPEPWRDIDDDPDDDEFRPRPPPGPYAPFEPDAADQQMDDGEETDRYDPGDDERAGPGAS